MRRKIVFFFVKNRIKQGLWVENKGVSLHFRHKNRKTHCSREQQAFPLKSELVYLLIMPPPIDARLRTCPRWHDMGGWL